MEKLKIKIKNIIDLIKDDKITIEIKEARSGASFGFYDRKNIASDFLEKEVKNINVQYFKSNRLLILEF